MLILLTSLLYNSIYIYFNKLYILLTAASTFAGDSSLGSANMEITEIKIVSTVCTGNHRSDAFSYPNLSSPGSWRIDMHTSPVLSTVKEINLY